MINFIKDNKKYSESLLVLKNLRLRAQILTSLSWLLGPLLIFKLTNSVSKAGLILIFEWLFRIALMIFTSKKIQRLGGLNSLLKVENIRIFIFLFLAVIGSVFLNNKDSLLLFILLLIVQLSFQLCGAILAVSCESLAHTLSLPNEKLKAQLLMRQGELLASLVALPLSGLIVAYIPYGFTLVCLIASLIAFLNKRYLVVIKSKINHEEKIEECKSSPGKIIPKKAILLSFFVILLNIPLSFLWGVFFFWVDRLEDVDVTSVFYSNYKFVEIIIMLFIVNTTMILSRKSDKLVIVIGSLFWILGFTIFCLESFSEKANSIMTFLTILFLASGTTLLIGYTKSLRQKLIPINSRYFWTTILVSFEGLSYITVGSLLFFLGLSQLFFQILGIVSIIGFISIIIVSFVEIK